MALLLGGGLMTTDGKIEDGGGKMGKVGVGGRLVRVDKRKQRARLFQLVHRMSVYSSGRQPPNGRLLEWKSAVYIESNQ